MKARNDRKATGLDAIIRGSKGIPAWYVFDYTLLTGKFRGEGSFFFVSIECEYLTVMEFSLFCEGRLIR